MKLQRLQVPASKPIFIVLCILCISSFVVSMPAPGGNNRAGGTAFTNQQSPGQIRHNNNNNNTPNQPKPPQTQKHSTSPHLVPPSSSSRGRQSIEYPAWHISCPNHYPNESNPRLVDRAPRSCYDPRENYVFCAADGAYTETRPQTVGMAIWCHREWGCECVRAKR